MSETQESQDSQDSGSAGQAISAAPCRCAGTAGFGEGAADSSLVAPHRRNATACPINIKGNARSKTKAHGGPG